MGRQRTLGAVALVSVLATSAAWYAGTQISSPAEARAKVKEPKASLITAPVERRQLSSNVVVRGDLAYDESTPVTLTASSETKAVVTKDPPAVGSQLTDGQLLVEVSGRPVFVLQGDLPVFRNLARGVKGDDVRQLEAGLQRLGVDPGPVDGTFDEATERGIAAFYLNAGYTVKEPSKEARDAVDEATSAVTSARQAARDAARAAGESSTTIKASERLQLESAVASASAALDSAMAAASSSAKQAEAGLASLQNELVQAQAAKRQADAVYAAATEPGAVDPDTGAPYTSTQLTELSNATLTAASAITAKAAEIDSAKAAADTDAREKFAAIGQAQRDLRIAQAAQLEGLKPSSDSSASSAVADAQRAVADAEKRLADAQAGVGVTVPLGELVFVRALPRQINEVHLRRGDTASGEVVTISGADLKIRSMVVGADRALLTVGTKVKIDDSSLDVHFEGVISEIADRPGTGASDNQGGADNSSDQNGGNGENGSSGSDDGEKYRVVITPGALPGDVDVETLAGVNFKITAPVKSTEGEVLAVPLAALSASADGSARVQVEDRPGSTRFVTVQKGLAAQGFVEVSVAAGAKGTLDEGDQVVVGQ